GPARVLARRNRRRSHHHRHRRRILPPLGPGRTRARIADPTDLPATRPTRGRRRTPGHGPRRKDPQPVLHPPRIPPPAAGSLVLVLAATLTACGTNGSPADESADTDAGATPHGYVEGAEETAEPQPRLVLADEN